MTQEEKVLVDKFVAYKKAEDENRKAGYEVLKELSLLAPHQKGEIIEWTEQKQKNVGTLWRPKYVDLKPVEKRAVLVRAHANVHIYNDGDIRFGYNFDFKLLKKDGSLGQNYTYPNNFEWTGEKYDKEF